MTVDDAAPPTPPGLPMLTDRRYLLGPLLGPGGRSEIFRSHDELLGRMVAVKIFLARLATTDSRRQHRETSPLAGSSHPGLVTIYDAREQDGRSFFAMQLVEGRAPAAQLREGPLPATETMQLGVVLGDDVAYIHGHGVLHRDMTRASMPLDHHDDPHLSYFGIVTLVESTPITLPGLMIGTAAHVTPEQIHGHPVGPGSDIYAMRLVLLECSTGRREYPGNATGAALARLRRRPEMPQAPPGPTAAQRGATTTDDPDERPSAGEVVELLRDAAPHIGEVSAVIDTPVQPALLDVTAPTWPATLEVPAEAAPRWGGHRRTLLVGALLVALAGGVVLSLPLLSNTPAPAATKPVVSVPSAPLARPSLIPGTRSAAGPQPPTSPTAAQPAPLASPSPNPSTPFAASPQPSTGPAAAQRPPLAIPTVKRAAPPASPAPNPSAPSTAGPQPPTSPTPAPSSPPAPAPTTGPPSVSTTPAAPTGP
ncbi:MAG: protein kinase domain-containing protein [Mycobacteriaceae bacterium]